MYLLRSHDTHLCKPTQWYTEQLQVNESNIILHECQLTYTSLTQQCDHNECHVWRPLTHIMTILTYSYTVRLALVYMHQQTILLKHILQWILRNNMQSIWHILLKCSVLILKTFSVWEKDDILWNSLLWKEKSILHAATTVNCQNNQINFTTYIKQHFQSVIRVYYFTILK